MDSCNVGGRIEVCWEVNWVCKWIDNHPPIKHRSRKDINLSVYSKDLSTSDIDISTMSKVTNISITWETHARLSEIGRKGESFNHIVERLLDVHEVSK